MKYSAPQEKSTPAPETVLIVDDEAGIRHLLRRKLEREGYHCEEADGHERAMSILATDTIALAVLDVRMPGKSGTELLPEIKNAYPDTAVIMATAVTDVGVAVQCLKQGADDYICKPFNMEEVSLGVGRALEKRRLQLTVREYQQHLEEKVEEQTEEIRRLFLGAIEALVCALEAKDHYTAGHSRRVTDIALSLGEELKLSTEELEDLRWASLLHDVGKIAVDPAIQNKSDRLTQEEYEHVMIHAHVGAGIVQPVVNDRVVEMIDHHHDYYDGNGLNQVTTESGIPLGARVLTLADAFDAMTSDRPYRPAMSVEEALDEIRSCVGTQFDPTVAEALFSVMSRKSRPSRLAESRT